MTEHVLKYRPDLNCAAGDFPDGSRGEFFYELGDDGHPDFFWVWVPQDNSPIRLPIRDRAGNERPSWEFSGSLEVPTLNPSVFVNPPTGWHGWIQGGIAKDA